jgi:hypothetical protein
MLKSMYGYSRALKIDKKKICNGCGPLSKSGWLAWLIPDTMYGMDISEVCSIHDWMYHYGTGRKGKEIADETFLQNMYTLISQGSWWLRWLRRRRAYKYYLAVKYFGDKAYMANKKGINHHFQFTDGDLERKEIKPFKKKLRKLA